MAATNEWLVIVKDHPGKYETRMKCRPLHLDNIRDHPAAGSIVMGGSMLGRSLTESDGKLETEGSALVAVYDTREQVVARLKEDVYFKEGVWDVDNAQIIAFKTAVRKAL